MELLPPCAKTNMELLPPCAKTTPGARRLALCHTLHMLLVEKNFAGLIPPPTRKTPVQINETSAKQVEREEN